MNTFQALGKFPVNSSQHAEFKSGRLWQSWSGLYPELYDSDDVRVAKTQAKMGYHFYEWLAALLIYQSTGYLSLIESYEFKIQKKKQKLLSQILPEAVLSAVREITAEGKVQCPDLLVYAPDHSDWYFCEVKGPNDRMREIQKERFQKLAEASGKPIQVIEFEVQRNAT